MPNLEQINLELIKSDSKLPNDIIAIAVLVNSKGNAVHSGLLVGVSGEHYIFHYPGPGSNYELLAYPFNGDWYYHKNLEVISPRLSLSFKQHCETILEKARPIYGFVYDGSYYDEEGVYISPNNLGEITTCVGFCLNVIKGFLWNNNNYMNYEDWSGEDNESDFFNQWKEVFLKQFPSINPDLYKSHIRRITPAELTASAFFKELPITKNTIDSIIEDIIQVLSNKRLIAA